MWTFCFKGHDVTFKSFSIWESDILLVDILEGINMDIAVSRTSCPNNIDWIVCKLSTVQVSFSCYTHIQYYSTINWDANMRNEDQQGWTSPRTWTCLGATCLVEIMYKYLSKIPNIIDIEVIGHTPHDNQFVVCVLYIIAVHSHRPCQPPFKHKHITVIFRPYTCRSIVFTQPGMQDMSIIICSFNVSVDWYWSWPCQCYL